MSEHYLKRELYELIRTDPTIFDWLQAGSLDGIWYLDLENPEEEWYSDEFKRLFGYEPHEIPNKSAWWQENAYPEDMVSAVDDWHLHVADPSFPYNRILRYRHKNGSCVWVQCRGIAIRDSEGKAVRFLGAHTDVTDLKETEQRLGKLVRDLQRSNRDLEQFAYAASHDLQTPLRKVSNFTKLLRQEYGHLFDETASQYMDFIEKGAERSKELINDLLSFSRAGREMAVDDFPLDHALDDALLILDEDVAEKGIEIERGSLPTVTGDKTLLTRVFQNLVGNAIKFRHPERDPIIHISAEDVGHSWQVCVRDNGIGMDMRHADRIFVIFQRIGGKKNGTGVGLALCKKIVERHGGCVWVDSVEGEGSSFLFTLPKEYVNGTGDEYATE